jgi:hypothetical protein
MAFKNTSNGFTFEQKMARMYWDQYKDGRTLVLRSETLGYPEGKTLTDLQYKRGVIYDYAGREIRPIHIDAI